jgi:hypothetical protein
VGGWVGQDESNLERQLTVPSHKQEGCIKLHTNPKPVERGLLGDVLETGDPDGRGQHNMGW